MIKFTLENKDYILEQANKAQTYIELMNSLGYSSLKCKIKLEKFLLENNFDTSKYIHGKLIGKIQLVEKNKEIIIEKARKFNKMQDLCVALGWSKKGDKNKEIANFLEKYAEEVLVQYQFFNNNASGIKFTKENKNKIFEIVKNSNTYVEILTKLDWYNNTRNRNNLKNFLKNYNFDLNAFEIKSFNSLIDKFNPEEIIEITLKNKSLNKSLIEIGLENNSFYKNRLADFLVKYDFDLHLLEEYSVFDLANYKIKAKKYLKPLEEPLEIVESNQFKIIKIASNSASLSHLEKLLGYNTFNYSRLIKLKNFLIKHNFDFSLFKRENLEKKSTSVFSDKKRLEETVKECTNFNQILKRYNLSSSGDQMRDLKKYLAYHEINIKHFRLKNKEKEKVFYTNEEMFIPNSQVDKTTIRRKILEQNLISYSCSHCDIGHMWFNQELILDLEHIDGNNKNQLLSNLTFLCPNCHRKTLTWGGRNTKKEKIEPNFIKAHDLNQIIKEKYAYAQVLAHYQDKNNKYNIQKIRQYIIENNININHFKFVKEGIKKPLDMSIFSTSSKMESNKIKEVILKHNLMSYQCITKNCPTHNETNALLSLDLDHTNGDKTDNRLENLRFLCPNCHRITLNWGNKKRIIS